MRGEVRDRILRVLMNNPTGKMSRYQIAKEAKSTYPWVREFLMKLADKKLVKDTKITDYPSLFQYWLKVTPKRKHRDYMVKKPMELLKNTKLNYALTTYQAENLIQGYLFPSRTDIHIKKEESEKWHEAIIKTGLVGGGNFRINLSDEHIFYHLQEKDGLKIISTPQLIIDLLKEGGTCTEAAEMLIGEMQKHV
ncbi:MAG: hypothetical protein ACE5J5_06000 [Candidatus Hydrothermarchaeales archaeon]